MREVFIILGSPNSPSGVLSTIATSRLSECAAQYTIGDFIICTGGWGEHFNVAERSHATFAKQFLLDKGIPEAAFLEAALSSNTVEDAVKIKSIIAKLEDVRLTIITSDYHVERVMLIFNTILKMYTMQFVGVHTALDEDTYATLVAHEKKAVNTIRENGLYY